MCMVLDSMKKHKNKQSNKNRGKKLNIFNDNENEFTGVKHMTDTD